MKQSNKRAKIWLGITAIIMVLGLVTVWFMITPSIDQAWEDCDKIPHDSEAYHDCRQQSSIDGIAANNKAWYVSTHYIFYSWMGIVLNPLVWTSAIITYYHIEE